MQLINNTIFKVLIVTLLFTYATISKAEHIFSYPVTINRVIDGDTFEVEINLGFNLKKFTILRLKGYDAPETTWRAKSDKELELGFEAKRFVEKRSKAPWVLYVSGKYKDSFGRILGNLCLPDNQCLSDELIEAGYIKHK